ncbi:hypothetical protein FLONG3_820 [Fusarium longipes]|uniref:Rhodopsin domain-containing protein n=1 Tax=Fusarium longipes TaxID=694270 RepID=A0A395T8P2_9HYPO|nr:hypothetical protein FLONG3_820 [Fusarium longipes]
MALDPSATSVQPTGLGQTLLILTIIFLILTSIVVILRCFTRAKYRIFGIDDALMLVGWMLHVAFSGIAMKAIFTGLGTKDEHLNDYLQSKARHWLWIGQIIYSLSLLPLKSSICVTLLRIAVLKAHRIIAWGTLVFTVVSTGIVTVGLFAICRPISAQAIGADAGSCPPQAVIVGYLVTASAVVTDWICALLPIFMLYKSNMKKATKISVSIILGLASLASLCTIIRLPYVKYYTIIPDYLYNVTNIVIWSIVESGIGIIAGSLPSLRKLVSSRFRFDTSAGSSPAHITPFEGGSRAVITANSAPAIRRSHIHRSQTDGEWEQLDDGSSSQKIYVKVDVEMQSLKRPTTSRSQGSREDLVY